MSFVLAMGVVSLLADACYEGARSAIGPYLALLGASATAVGIVAGTGELVGYGLRYLTGAARGPDARVLDAHHHRLRHEPDRRPAARRGRHVATCSATR